MYEDEYDEHFYHLYNIILSSHTNNTIRFETYITIHYYFVDPYYTKKMS